MSALRSLNVRLLFGAALWTGGLLLSAAVVSRERLRAHLEERYVEFLTLQLDELAAAIVVDRAGSVTLARPLADRRFANPSSGLSWEVRDDSRRVLTSEGASRGSGTDPLEVARTIALPDSLQLIARADRRVVEGGELFLQPGIAVGALALAALLLIGGAVTVQRALRTFRRLRERLAAVRGGAVSRLDGSYPPEIQPLVDDLNSLLQHNENSIARAAQHAGNLAHALKTPMAVIANEAFHLTTAGDGTAGPAIGSQIRLMEERVGTYLARARAAASGQGLGARSDTQTAIEGVVRVMRRLHADRHVDIETLVACSAFRGEQHDLEEIVGNLIDNACKWARRRIVVACARRDETLEITVDDDGCGIVPGERDALFSRAARLDEQAPGAGYGLTIVHELVQTYGGSLALTQAPIGGLRVMVLLPAAT